MNHYIDADQIPYYLDTSDEAPMEGRKIAFKSDIDKIPVADVVPRSEVEGLQKKIDDYIVEVFTLEQTIGKLKAENDELEINLAAMRTEANSYKTQYENLAKEIFAEIERLLAMHFCSCLPKGATEHYDYYEGDLGEAIAELKKKYPESEGTE